MESALARVPMYWDLHALDILKEDEYRHKTSSQRMRIFMIQKRSRVSTDLTHFYFFYAYIWAIRRDI